MISHQIGSLNSKAIKAYRLHCCCVVCNQGIEVAVWLVVLTEPKAKNWVIVWLKTEHSADGYNGSMNLKWWQSLLRWLTVAILVHCSIITLVPTGTAFWKSNHSSASVNTAAIVSMLWCISMFIMPCGWSSYTISHLYSCLRCRLRPGSWWVYSCENVVGSSIEWDLRFLRSSISWQADTVFL
jgi:hypothetical protein